MRFRYTLGAMKNIQKLLTALLLSISVSTGCAAVMGALPTIIQLVQDAALILDDIDEAARPYFERAENKQLLGEYSEKMLVAKKALRVALRASEGGKRLSEAEVDEAFEDFREAYKDLLGVLRDNNLMTDQGALKSANGVTIDVEEPLAIARAK